ncbi:MAG: hypothetical protein A4E54_00590 [Pelotomaculum sp. PtaB.Bin117]|nr:MAG: hypothetical protein A4E54_00590 [Pelotomaculum sp. PtaB.Bin117]OPY63237.1 MAG: hypothetical protein A4E56_00711 [Pelotomaculum sp. PtaU1.Bin065]
MSECLFTCFLPRLDGGKGVSNWISGKISGSFIKIKGDFGNGCAKYQMEQLLLHLLEDMKTRMTVLKMPDRAGILIMIKN